MLKTFFPCNYCNALLLLVYKLENSYSLPKILDVDHKQLFRETEYVASQSYLYNNIQ